ncbi:RagB/SusD family nutrient uptake outer membrane protein [Olivibacter sp. SDN3]|uniref:RagB/SusD family nutrient uptake outer membrane protein n=1 Tax=Olivibacter sp. SDN3 TaxID=2764720 RepID=UPI0016515D99|nr:RagB/SusD family nutrient uptake outer membrane protein [Olivibacter sp. SDN3]QNL50838.1 RagB/SusD family nutrient uptake outer membrane protein [Olivibacter sp. SDN3]
MKRTIKKLYPFAIAIALTATACKKEYLETSPTSSIDANEVFTTTDGAMVALNGTIRSMYSSLTNHGNFGQKSYDLVLDLMGEDMVVHKQGYGWLNTDYNYSAPSNANPDQRPDRTWFYYYRIISNANRIIDGLDEAIGSEEDKASIRGQALALRAHSYFYLVNFFGHNSLSGAGVPLYTEPTSEGNPRSSVQEVYNLIFSDLSEAETLLEGKSRIHRSHVDLAVAQGIHARAALQIGNYDAALEYATKAIESSGLSLYTAQQHTAAGFNTLSAPEWLWGLEVIVDQATIFASFYSHIDNREATGGYAALGTQKKITKALYDRIPEGDVRRNLFNGSQNPDLPIYSQVKFQLRQPGNWASDYLLMRLAEMYLIKAEAEARLGNAAQATETLQTLVSTRYPAYNAGAFSGNALLEEILLQRKIELWGEGFGLLDVKRLGNGLNRPTGDGNHGGGDLNSDANAANFAPGELVLPANTNRWLFAIPQDEINANGALTAADQNPQ